MPLWFPPARKLTQAAPVAKTDTVTLTAAEVLGAFPSGIGFITGDPTAAANYTLPTVANVEAALPADFAVNDAFDCAILNLDAALAITVLTNTGWTLVGNMVVAAATSVLFRARKTGAGAFTLYRFA